MLILLCSYYDVLARKESSAVSDTDATKNRTISRGNLIKFLLVINYGLIPAWSGAP